jgi:hypothetical protein
MSIRKWRWRIAGTVMTTAIVGTFGMSAAALASNAETVTFSASHDGASAGWSNGKGSPIELTLGSDSATTFAQARLHDVKGALPAPTQGPSFMTDKYNAGSPRYYITLGGGCTDTLWGYPTNAGYGTFVWAINNGNSYLPWAGVRAAELAKCPSATVSKAFVIADGDQAPGTTDRITGLTFGSNNYN